MILFIKIQCKCKRNFSFDITPIFQKTTTFDQFAKGLLFLFTHKQKMNFAFFHRKILSLISYFLSLN